MIFYSFFVVTFSKTVVHYCSFIVFAFHCGIKGSPSIQKQNVQSVFHVFSPDPRGVSSVSGSYIYCYIFNPVLQSFEKDIVAEMEK